VREWGERAMSLACQEPEKPAGCWGRLTNQRRGSNTSGTEEQFCPTEHKNKKGENVPRPFWAGQGRSVSGQKVETGTDRVTVQYTKIKISMRKK